MVSRYPHILLISGSPEPPYQDEFGNWQTGAPASPISVECRAEPIVKGSYTINDQDGQRIEFSYVVHMRVVSDIKTGVNVEIKKGGLTLFAGTAKRFMPGQMNSRLWV
jgi:hypothetical protein